MGHTVRALVVDDEPVAREALRELIAGVSWMSCVGEAADGIEAVAEIRAQRPDLVFLDVQMPGMTGIEVVEQSSTDLAVIFTTAHDEYAMTAFELGAIDYLRKPFGKARFAKAVERARPHLDARAARASNAAGSAPLVDRMALATASSEPLTQLFVRDHGQVIPVKVTEIVRCEADGDYVAIYANGRRYLVYMNLSDLAARLDGRRFVRVHRSHLINLDRVTLISPFDANRLEVKMADGSMVVSSRTGTRSLRRLGI